MNRLAVLAAVPLLALSGVATAQQGGEHWNPTSTTAQITGPITLSPTQLIAAGKTIPLAVAADVKAFKTDQGTFPARVLRVTRSVNPTLRNNDRFCTGPVRWFVVWREQSDSLGMAVFGGANRPTSEDDPSLCGTFLYSR